MIVLDTNIISELMRRRPAARVVGWVDEQDASALAITAVTVAELLYGVARLADGARKTELATAVDALVREDFAGRVLPFDAAAATHYADLVAERERQGRPISTADGQIAAICRLRASTLATRNVRDFDETGITVVDPWSAVS
ncbi:MAG TPA: type II toxin-antitoxin system VapC family toxin [Conexibacter sp.]|nr:type II toxin-antitoxin system VapC family toxin [Conexibacter sp.]